MKASIGVEVTLLVEADVETLDEVHDMADAAVAKALAEGAFATLLTQDNLITLSVHAEVDLVAGPFEDSHIEKGNWFR